MTLGALPVMQRAVSELHTAFPPAEGQGFAFVIGSAVPPGGVAPEASQTGELRLSWAPKATQPYPLIGPLALPLAKVTVSPLGAMLPPPAPPPPPPAAPPPPPLLSLLAQDVAKIAKAPHATNEVKARLTFVIVLFLAFISPSRLVFAYSIAEAPEMGKDI
jgi:hypothetical protein